jgi:hypothetical protein
VPQLVSLDRLGPWTARTWINAEPGPAAGPADGQIGEVTLDSPAVLGIGVCLPVAMDSEPGASSTDTVDVALASLGAPQLAAWLRDGGTLRPLALERLDRAPGPPGVADLYRPASIRPVRGSNAPAADRTTPDLAMSAWAPGRYVLRVAAGPTAAGLAATPGDALYIAIDVTDRR